MNDETTFCQPHSVAEPCRRCNAVPASTLNPEALERLRERASMQTSGGVTLVRSPDLRALLDAHDEALDGLHAAVELLDCSMGVPCRPDLDDRIRAVLAKVGRR